MTLDLTWFDLVLAILFAGIVVLGARRGLIGLVTSLVGLLLWFVVNVLGNIHPLVSFVLALGSGALLAIISRNFLSEVMDNLSDISNAVAGGVGGFFIALGVVCALAMSFPVSYNAVTEKSAYPSVSLPLWIGEAVRKSAVTTWLTQSSSQGGVGIWDASAGAVRNLLIPDYAR